MADEWDTGRNRVGRRQVLTAGAGAGTAGLLGVTSLALPTAAAAASIELAGVPTSSLVLHLDASLPGESPETTWLDRSGVNNASPTADGITYVAAAGTTPAHYSLDGSATAVIPVASGAVLFGSAESPPSGYTKMIWFRRDRDGGTHNLISSALDGAPHYFWFKEPLPHRRLTSGHDGTAGAQQATLEIGAGVWTFAATTFSTTEGLRILSNTSDRDWSNALVSEDIAFPDYAAAPTGGLSFQVGGYAGSGTNRLPGDVATVVVHSRALTVTEVRSYYAATVDRFHPLP